MLRSLVICVAMALVIPLGACRDGREAQLAKVKETVCGCKTAGCAEAAMKDVPQSEIVSNHRTQLLARQMLDCLAKLYDEQRPDSDDEPAPAPSTETAPTGPETSEPASAKKQ
jgi:hypothetical protein